MRPYVVIDFGGTQIRAAIATAEGQLIALERGRTPRYRGPDEILKAVKRVIRTLLNTSSFQEFRSIGVAAPGPLDSKAGIIIESPILPGWRNVPIVEVLEKEFGIPVVIENDANLAALGEHRFGAGRGHNSMIYLTVSTGLGGGIIANGQLITGESGFGGELGHISLDPYGPKCPCGNYGCLEALASGTSIASEAQRIIRHGLETQMLALANNDIAAVNAEIVVNAAKQGDIIAREIIERAAFFIGIGVINFLHLFNPSLVIIGGGVSEAGEMLFEPIRRLVASRAMKPISQTVRIEPAVLGDTAGLLGALVIASATEK